MERLLRHMPHMPGVNHSMFYFVHMFMRFCWHTEDAFLNSVSYLRRGSADNIWYAIPLKYVGAFETYAAENPSAQRSLMCKTTIFDLRELKSRGIECHRIRHKPGSFVLTAPRAYHAGFNCGFNITEAVNFANPGWFPIGRQASLCARQGAYTLIVPYEYLLSHEAKSLRDAHLTTTSIERISPSARSGARILAGELGAVLEEVERRLREYAQSSNCRIAMLNDVDRLIKNNHLGPEF
ncbi:unnamed protein product [Chondrus crispus]|uniref:JmjC domain-containing protein n=1 Tax=Chondrus crispus TaxID=2769 RepID=R7Q4B6_CHOCR|nr:unnamed protein product [Chondrus crispus]CDF32854.1 unnamed protein product [Chondrus crispus]|eukprot:XP_005712655.1 unnamed protein product [Chondrus crispus]